jgi:hypothetical protein
VQGAQRKHRHVPAVHAHGRQGGTRGLHRDLGKREAGRMPCHSAISVPHMSNISGAHERVIGRVSSGYGLEDRRGRTRREAQEDGGVREPIGVA